MTSYHQPATSQPPPAITTHYQGCTCRAQLVGVRMTVPGGGTWWWWLRVVHVRRTCVQSVPLTVPRSVGAKRYLNGASEWCVARALLQPTT